MRRADVPGAADEQDLHAATVLRYIPTVHALRPQHRRAQVAGPLARGRPAQDPDRPGASPSSTRSTCSPTPPAPGLHVGHCEGYTATDVITRWKRMQGFRVLHPMGWDAFGLPAENYAIKHGVHPRVTTAAAIANFRRQIDAVGFAYDWEREVDTTDPGVREVDAVDLPQALRARARLRGRSSPSTGARRARPASPTKRSARGAASAAARRSCARTCGSGCCGSPATPIGCSTDLDELDWPASTLAMQRNWIGRSEGAEVVFTSAAPVAGRRSASSPPAPTRSTARPTWCSRPSTRWSPS